MKSKLLVLFKNHPTDKLLNDLINLNDEDLSVIGIEYNLVLGIEKIRSFHPQLIVLDEDMVPMATKDFIDIIQQYSDDFYILLLSDRTRIADMPHVHSVIDRRTFDAAALDMFVRQVRELHSENSASKQEILHPSEYYSSLNSMLSKNGFSPRNLSTLKRTYGWKLMDRIHLITLYPINSERTLPRAMLDDLQYILDRYSGGYVFVKDSFIGMIVNHSLYPDEGSSTDEFAKITRELRHKIENQYKKDFVIFATNEFALSELERHTNTLFSQSSLGFFCKDMNLMYFNINNAHFDNDASRDYPVSKVNSLFHKLFYSTSEDFQKSFRSFYFDMLKRSFSVELCSNFKHQLELMNLACLLIYPDALSAEDIKVSKELFENKYQTIDEEYQRVRSLFYLWNIYFNSRKDTTNEHIINSMIYMILHIGENVSLNKLAKEISVSPTHLSHLFNKEIGMSFHFVQMNLRILYAKRLLKCSLYKVYEVADKCGFADYRHFCNTFKKYESVTPTEYQRNAAELNKNEPITII